MISLPVSNRPPSTFCRESFPDVNIRRREPPRVTFYSDADDPLIVAVTTTVTYDGKDEFRLECNLELQASLIEGGFAGQHIRLQEEYRASH